MKPFLLVMCALLLPLTPPAAAAPLPAGFDAAAFDAKVEAMMALWNQPGLSVAIVKDGRIIHERGYGVRKVGSSARVDAQTLFGIGSLTKSFTSATVAKLVSEGKLEWDAPVTRYLPWFRMPRDRDTDEVTLRDLLSMRSGIGSAEYTFRRVSFDRADHVRRIRFLAQRHPLRAQYLYTTDSYTALGVVVSTVTGKPWETFAAETFFTPLGMMRTDVDDAIAAADPDAASPHLDRGGRMEPIAWVYEDDAATPAGGINSSAHDMALWLLFELADGRTEKGQLIPAAVLHETHVPQTPVRGAFAGDDWVTVAGEGEDRLRFRSYAMGWAPHDYRGHMVLTHGGGQDGFRSRMAILPDDGIGVVVLANADDALIPLAVMQTAIDDALGVSDRQWGRRFHERAVQREADAAAALAAANAARVPGTHPSRPLSAYAGSFADAGAFGPTTITVEKDHLVVSAGRARYDLEHWHHDLFKARPRWPYEMESRDFFVAFQLDQKAEINAFRFSTGYDFKRVPTGR